MRYIKGGLAVLALLAMIIFAIQNLEMIKVSFLSWSLSIPQVVVIAGTYILGMITGAWLFDFLKMLLKRNTASESK
jgi:lipopolysaccharide assembly protein A